MLVMNIDIWPYGDESSFRNLAKLSIANVGSSISSPKNLCDYVWFYYEPNPIVGEPIEKIGVVRKFNRLAPTFMIVNTVTDILKTGADHETQGHMSLRETMVANHIKKQILGDIS
jgi:hypothetical protein